MGIGIGVLPNPVLSMAVKATTESDAYLLTR